MKNSSVQGGPKDDDLGTEETDALEPKTDQAFENDDQRDSLVKNSVRETMSKRRSKWTAAHMLQIYSKGYLISLGLQYFNTGTTAMVDLVNTKLMDEYYNLSPAQATAVLSIPNLAWSPKILYGFWVD